MRITKNFHFDAAHQLTDYHGKCERMHGHTYRLEVTVSGPVRKNGMVLDFALLKNVVKKYILDELDHQNLNDVFKNPTAENIATWIWKKLKPLPRLLKAMSLDRKYLDDIQFYYARQKSAEKIRPNQTDFSKIKLFEVRLFEGEGACVVID
ncbi:MAG: 6-carboxytetrahydropterin synthase QueD [Patescibacteria group bacterium]